MPDTSRTESGFRSVAHIWLHRCEVDADKTAMLGRGPDGAWQPISWALAASRVRYTAGGLHSLGVRKGDRCAILCTTRPEWVVMDMAILTAGAATSTIYPSNTPEECAWILKDSGARFCFAEDAAQVAKLRQVRHELPALERVIVLDGEGSEDDWVVSMAELHAEGVEWNAQHPGRYEELAQAVGPEDLATIIYTSGTTGRPKGVMLSHDSWVFEADAVWEMGLLTPDDTHYLFLPLSHGFAKMMVVAFIRCGATTAVDGDMGALVQNLAELRPTIMAAVPRIFEKVYNKVVDTAKQAGGAKYAIFSWAVAVGSEVSQLRQRGQEPGALLALKLRLADALVFTKLRALFGGRIKYFISGGAPLSRDIAEFFHAAGVLVLEGYGLTESSAASTVNRPDAYKFGTVGLPCPGVSVKLADDGEILLGGRGIMQGYFKLPQVTAETLTEDGWLRTGDIGELDSDGFLKITDRKKDLIITAGGKNIGPQIIENRFKVISPYVSQIVMHGDTRNFCVALITIDEETVGRWARERGLGFDSYAELAALPQVKQLLMGDIQTLNDELVRYETIKDIHILDHDLSVESGELTPKLSVKRRVVERRYKDVLDGFYAGTVAGL